MTHIVIHDDSQHVTHYAEFDDVRSAAAYLEDLVNDEGGADARLYALEPVEFAVKSYVRVEIGGSAESVPAAHFPSADTDALESADHKSVDHRPLDEDSASHDVFTDEPVDDTVEYVEAAMASVDAFAPPSMPERSGEPAPGEVRRGLFGR